MFCLQGFSHWVTRGRFSGLTSKFSPLGSMLNFDADVKKTSERHQRENRLSSSKLTHFSPRPSPLRETPARVHTGYAVA